MLGAIIGDIAGSRFEWDNCKSKDFELLAKGCGPTDDSNMTLAVAQAILQCNGDFNELPVKAVASMRELGRKTTPKIIMMMAKILASPVYLLFMEMYLVERVVKFK